MRSIHEREREKRMAGPIGNLGGRGFPDDFGPDDFKPQAMRDLDQRDQEQFIRAHGGLSEPELKRLKSTTSQRLLYLVVGIAFLLLLLVGILGANVFHFW